MKNEWPMRKVVKVRLESVAVARYGSMTSAGRWVLTLECGHQTDRYSKSEKKPKRARCRTCRIDSTAAGRIYDDTA